MWEEGNGVGDAFFLGIRGIHSVAAVMIEGRAKVPAVGAFGIPGATLGFVVVCDDLTTGWCQRVFVEVVRAVDLCVG